MEEISNLEISSEEDADFADSERNLIDFRSSQKSKESVLLISNRNKVKSDEESSYS